MQPEDQYGPGTSDSVELRVEPPAKVARPSPIVKQAPVLSAPKPVRLKAFAKRLLGRRDGEPFPSWFKRLAEALMMVGCFGRGLNRALPAGEIVRVHPRYRWLGWNLDEYEAFRTACVDAKVVFDVGANVGAYSILFGLWARETGGRVFAF